MMVCVVGPAARTRCCSQTCHNKYVIEKSHRLNEVTQISLQVQTLAARCILQLRELRSITQW